jgi:nucleoside phosphorylase
LTLETDAVESVFDQHWDADDDPYGKASGDRNSYSTGVIAHHNVVLVHMPGTGKGSAASVAESCRRSFTEIELALVVGICGGVPFDENREEIFLGDVVISSGIVQYDFGRRYPDRFVRKDTLDDNLGRPNPEIRGFLRKLQRRKGRADLRDKMIKYLGDLQTELGEAATYPGIAEEKLFRPSYRHRHQIPSTCPTCAASVGRRDPVCEAAVQSSCDQLGCDETELIPRRRPDNQDYALHQPAIHFGLVASGDTVMKSGQDRDEIAAKEHVIAFEMEGAGVWDNLPCVVIKGVCDYADSHKNEKWQNYAAATAAAGMKAFLNNWSTGSRDIM